MQSNKSLSAAAAKAAEAAVKQALQQQEGVSSADPKEIIAPGGYPDRGDALGGPRKTVHFSDEENASADARNRQQTASSSADAQGSQLPGAGHDAAPGSEAKGQATLRGVGEGSAEQASAQQRPETEQQIKGNAARPRVRSPFVSPFAADEGESAPDQAPQEASSAAARPAGVVRSPFAPAEDPAPDRAPQEASSAASSAAARPAAAVRSPFASANEAEVQRKPAAVPAGISPFAAAQDGADMAAAPEQAAPSKGRPPVIRSAFEQEPGP
jgi:hypothetical protein